MFCRGVFFSSLGRRVLPREGAGLRIFGTSEGEDNMWLFLF